MGRKQDIVEAINTVDARLATLHDRILASGEAPLPEGTWRVRDALSHLAARANGVARIMARVEAAANPQAAQPAAPRNVDEINAGQVEERTSKTVAELLEEIRTGHAAAIAAIAGIDDTVLAREIPLGFRPGEAAVGELMVMGGARHDHGHLDQIEAALK
ncbi:MAG: maleylpyruvate isomerase N-terminal domain-containing protein [Chloroflexi bacterium]|nr:maleylpyruvate isomerase N-terminal domain-containing protein [Chloroflexota bacterium]MDA1240133.1 maleylpyruvate isomerase N-terminal domain-containing protein [Chloroflexota bacterium]